MGKSEEEQGGQQALTPLKPEVRVQESEHSFLEGGWGWWVVLGSALSHFLIVGVPRSFGVFYEELLVRYERSSSETAWVIALCNTIRMLFGPLSGVLCDKFSCRKVVFVGALLTGCGWTISAFSTGIPYLYLSLGVVGGLGGSLVFTPAYIIVGQYFSKKKGKAMGISTIGSGLGTVVLAPFISYMLQFYGYTGAMLIVGALMFNNCVAAALYRPVEHNRPEQPSSELKSQEVLVSEETEDLKKTPRVDVTSKPERTRSEKILSKCKKIFRVLKNLTFFLYCIEITTMSISIQTFLTFLPGLAKERRAAGDKGAAILLSIMGIADMIGRLLVRKRRRLFHALIGVPMALFCILTGAMETYVTLSVLTVLFGVLAGAFHSQRATIVSEFVPKKQMSSTVGWVILFQGLGNVLGPPVAGALRDAQKTYTIGFYFAGSCLCVTCLLFIANYFFQQWRQNSSEDSTNTQAAAE